MDKNLLHEGSEEHIEGDDTGQVGEEDGGQRREAEQAAKIRIRDGGGDGDAKEPANENRPGGMGPDKGGLLASDHVDDEDLGEHRFDKPAALEEGDEGGLIDSAVSN